jgi:hypothetical protein
MNSEIGPVVVPEGRNYAVAKDAEVGKILRVNLSQGVVLTGSLVSTSV